MSPNQENLVEMAKQGDSKALAVLINRSLQPKGITVKTNLKDGCLQILVEADQVPNQESTTQFLVRGIRKLDIKNLDSLKIFGKQEGQDFPDWSQEILLQQTLNELSEVDDTTIKRQALRETELANKADTAKQPTEFISSHNLEPAKKLVTHTAKVPQKESDSPNPDKLKNVALKVLSSIWKWYISGFKSRPDLPLFLSPRLYRIVFTLFAFVWITSPLGWYKDTTTLSNSSVTSHLKPGCAEAGGRMWTNVRLYRDSLCTEPFATIYGGGKLRSGDRGVLIKFDTGDLEWKVRSAVSTQSFVKTDDTALNDKLWQHIDQ